ncbi:DUF418 domain-containing protein [Sphingomonas alba]|uniref:DUF418 domain-containing protein n=1 Tax=Sphingomonas alba TaxID=2908208 RepID=A0ABT0RQF6_9SPHN|nr:DUF418 domain-containing protein [Sphingomonas alba]MCL6684524.1 DUF418 domain-containing protein [Sphingomonas alba]
MNAEANLGIDRVRGSERIASLDVIRGLAILFILFMNIPVMGGYEFILFDERYPTWTNADWWTTFIRMTWMDGTQRGLLELLFGAGILIMARRAMEPDGPVAVADLHYRRNIWLALFGLANAFLLMWFGDILLVYGLAAVFLFPFRKLGPKALCGLASIFLVALTLNGLGDYRESQAKHDKLEQIQTAQASGKKLNEADKKALQDDRKQVLDWIQLPAQNAEAKKKIADADKARHSTFAAYWTAQFDGWKFVMGWFWIIEAEIVATMLIGMAFYRWGIIQGKAKQSTYWALLLVGYGAGMWLRGSVEWYKLAHIRGPHWEWILTDIARLLVTFGHVGLIQLILTSSLGRRLLSPFQAAGRMPLTVYLGTSFLMMWILFAPWGLNMFGVWGQAKLMAVAAVVIVAELIAANLWMRSYDNGPMEWVWKSLAYQRREPFRKARQQVPDAVPSPI